MATLIIVRSLDSNVVLGQAVTSSPCLLVAFLTDIDAVTVHNLFAINTSIGIGMVILNGNMER